MKKLRLNTEEDFGVQLKRERLKRGFSQAKVAQRMGYDVSNISTFERERKSIGRGSIVTMFKYAKALGFANVQFDLVDEK